MKKVNIGTNTFVYPNPVTLLGTTVEGKANFMALGWISRVNAKPPMIGVGVYKVHYTPKGIHETKTFSVNFPGVDMVEAVDYCGLVSGRETDKVADCKFNIFYGKLTNAPLISECPVNLECQALHILNLGGNEMVVGQIEEVYATDPCLTDGEPDVNKIKPFFGLSARRTSTGSSASL